ncbi:MAG: DUF1010 domain-containing protein, partial [Bacteroidales bacterium]|nr:DUF1010 domain-containing protein [Bacteroidales bacterium]
MCCTPLPAMREFSAHPFCLRTTSGMPANDHFELLLGLSTTVATATIYRFTSICSVISSAFFMWRASVVHNGRALILFG